MFEQSLNERPSLLNWQLALPLFGLMLLGLVFIYSASLATESGKDLALWEHFYFKQIVWYTAGLSAAIVVCLVDYRSLARWSVVAYWVTIILLIAVLIPGIGKKIWGARRWIDLGPYQLQPSEFAKLALIFMNAHFLSRPADELRLSGNFWKALGMMALPFFLILFEPDLGSALVLIPVTLVMMYVAGTPKRFLLRLAGGVSALIALLLVDILFSPENFRIVPLQEYQKHRLFVFFGVDFPVPPNATEADKQRIKKLQRDKSYNVEQALISVGSGGLTGKGWRQGTQNLLGYLPRGVAHNDFIFSVIAEEKGFIGSVAVLTLYSVILFAGIRIAGEARDRLGKLLATGVVVMLFSQVFINIGMNIRIMPVTGVPLPLLSYGGSSVLCSLIAIGVLHNVYLYRRS